MQLTHSFLACKLSVGTYAHSLMRIPLHVMNHTSLASFKFSLFLTFDSLIITCVSVDLFCSTYLGSYELLEAGCLFSHPIFEKFSVIISLNKIFFAPSLLFYPGIPILSILIIFIMPYKSWGISYSFGFFFLPPTRSLQMTCL